MQAERSSRLITQWLALALLSTTVAAQSPSRPDTANATIRSQGYTLEPATAALARPPLPQDTGRAAFDQLLRKLKTTARLMHTVAHPDDEDGGMLTLQSRGKGTSTLLFTLTRGEGGQNKTGSNLFDELGVLRALELLESDRYYGVDQRFSRAADFGFSKTPQESLSMWAHQPVSEGAMPPDDHNPALADMVRAIRVFRPDVLVSRFTGLEKTSHGHHQAAGLLSREAFKAAADPKRFPEQIAEGLLPWQPLKLYVGAREGPANVQFDTGANDQVLGTSYIALSMQGLRHQLSQGAAGWSVSPGPHWTRYALADKSPNINPAAQGQDYFDGIDATLPGLFARLTQEDQRTLSWLKDALTEIAGKIADASNNKDLSHASKPLVAAATQMDNVVRSLESAGLSPAGRELLLTRLGEKRQQLYEAANMAMGITLEARIAPGGKLDAPMPPLADARTLVAPGDRVFVVAHLHNGSKELIDVSAIRLDVPESWITKSYVGENHVLHPGEDIYANFALSIGKDARYSRPIYTRSNPETDTVWTVIPGARVTEPLPPVSIRALADYVLYKPAGDLKFRLFGATTTPSNEKKYLPGSSIAAPVNVAYTDSNSKEQSRPLAIAPSYSVLIAPGSQVVPTASTNARPVTVDVSTIERIPSSGELTLLAPEGWQVEPARQSLSFDNAHREHKITFNVTPSARTPGRYQLHANFRSGNRDFSEGYSTVTREDLGTFYYYQPAVQNVRVIDVQVPNLKVGYIMGAGDEIPTVLQQLGLNVQLISPQQLASADLKQYDTVVLGIRAYDTQQDVRKYNSRLLDYVRDGGTLIVQYNADWTEFNSGKFTPYPATMSRDRVSVEEAPVRILAPSDSIFTSPNRITSDDFHGWVQERGLYFMSDFDKQYTPLLSCNDPGEPSRDGGLLRASYGKGTYIYTGYAFFRQLPNGVPGAARLFVNLIAAGHAR